MPHPDAPGLDGFVDDPDAFLDGTLHQAMRRYEGGDPDTIAVADRLWDDALTRGTRRPGFRLVRDGSTVDHVTYCRRAGLGHRTVDDVIQPNRVLELYDDGATVVLQGLQLTDPHLARVANNLALAVDQPVQVNAYLSPPSARGLDLHVDLHDVFVLQLEGSKRWRLWEPLERTLDAVRGGPPIAPPTLGELGPPALDVMMRRGDVLYVPRGHPHCAETVAESSAHLTVGIMVLTWQQAVRGAVEAAIAEGSWRTSVRFVSTAAPGPSVDDVAAVLRPHLDAAAVRRWLIGEVWRRQPATRLRPRRRPAVDLATPVVLTPGPLVWLQREERRCVLGLGDRRLTLPIEAHPFLAHLLTAAGPVAAVAVDGLDDASKRVVLDRLVAEGLLSPRSRTDDRP
ncbi:MAG: JmjC domain-containing protein [Ilumatobacteraceae bacterium]